MIVIKLKNNFGCSPFESGVGVCQINKFFLILGTTMNLMEKRIKNYLILFV